MERLGVLNKVFSCEGADVGVRSNSGTDLDCSRDAARFEGNVDADAVDPDVYGGVDVLDRGVGNVQLAACAEGNGFAGGDISRSPKSPLRACDGISCSSDSSWIVMFAGSGSVSMQLSQAAT